MRIKVIDNCNGEVIFLGSASDFLKDNEYDEDLMGCILALGSKDMTVFTTFLGQSYNIYKV